MVTKRFFKTKDECEVSFELANPEAEQVELVCESNGWRPIPMRRGKKGGFRTRIRLPLEQRYQFRYLVNRRSWVNDSAADAYLVNEFGTENCVLDTAPEGSSH